MNIVKECPKDETPFVRPDLELRLLKSKILKKKFKPETLLIQYNRIKNAITIDICAEQAYAVFSCPICPLRSKMYKYFTNGGDRSSWNLSNYYRHVCGCLAKSNNLDRETHGADESNFFEFLIF